MDDRFVVIMKLQLFDSRLSLFIWNLNDWLLNRATCVWCKIRILLQLTALVAGLMAKLWCQKTDPVFLQILMSIGPLVEFEGLLSYYGDEIDMWGDMVVAVEDLATVSFTLVASKSKYVSVNRFGRNTSSLPVFLFWEICLLVLWFLEVKTSFLKWSDQDRRWLFCYQFLKAFLQCFLSRWRIPFVSRRYFSTSASTKWPPLPRV